jgi:hypothetical protein
MMVRRKLQTHKRVSSGLLSCGSAPAAAAMDILLTRRHPQSGRLQLAVKVTFQTLPNGTKKTELRTPGALSQIHKLRSRLLDELLGQQDFFHKFLTEEDQARCRGLLEDLLMSKSSSDAVLYSGYVDDPRNTDNAWIETEA